MWYSSTLTSLWLRGEPDPEAAVLGVVEAVEGVVVYKHIIICCINLTNAV